MMDKNEAVHQLSELGCMSVSNAEDLYDSFFEKPVVPQCVADWYEGNKQNLDLNLSGLVFDLATNSPIYYDEEFKAWVKDNKKTFITTLVNMHQFGYEVEKEKRYTVKLKNKSGYEDYLVDTNNVGFRFYNNLYTQNREHTRKELEEAGFGWVFDCEGIEIEEVE